MVSFTKQLKQGLFGDELAKLSIAREPNWQRNLFDDAPNVLFNPSTITLTKATHWNKSTQNESDTGEQQFVGGEPAIFQIDLFFDTYEGVDSPTQSLMQAGLGAIANLATPSILYPFLPASAVSVTEYTNRVRDLTLIDSKLKRPPRCRIAWGHSFDKSGLLFEGYLKEVTQTFTLFLADGTPVRATLGCTFEEYQSSEDAKRKNPGSSARDDDPIYVVRRGDTLSSIAYQEYDDPSEWRVIARENNITNPRDIQPGQVLTIPVLRSNSSSGGNR